MSRPGGGPDAGHVGRRYRAAARVIDASRAAAFQRVVGGGGEGGPDPEVGTGGDPLPPMLVAVDCLGPALESILADPEVGIELAGLVHAEQSFEWPEPLRPGEAVETVAEIASVESRRRLTFVAVALHATGDGGRTVCAGRSVLVLREDGG